jgi:hypothetical protein
MKRQSQYSMEFVEVPVIAAADPTSDTIKMAFPARGESPTTFYTGSWKSGVQPGGTYLSRCLVGAPDGVVTLAVGFYDVYVQITDAPEVPVLYGGVIEIF